MEKLNEDLETQRNLFNQQVTFLKEQLTQKDE